MWRSKWACSPRVGGEEKAQRYPSSKPYLGCNSLSPYLHHLKYCPLDPRYHWSFKPLVMSQDCTEQCLVSHECFNVSPICIFPWNEHTRRLQTKRELRGETEHELQVNRPGLFVPLFAFASFLLAVWSWVGHFPSVGLTFSILQNRVVMGLPVLAKIYHLLHCSESL